MKKTALFVASVVCASSLWTVRAEDAAAKPAEAAPAVEPATLEKPATEATATEKAAKVADKAGRGPREGRMMAGMAADKNGDGLVSLEEFKAQHEERTAVRKEKMGDKFDPAKVPSADALFTRMDKNGDGNLTKDELQAGRQPRMRPAKKDGVQKEGKQKDGAQ